MRKNDRMESVWRIITPILIYTGIHYVVYILVGILCVTGAVISIKQAGGTLTYQDMLAQTATIMNSNSHWLTLASALACLPAAAFLFRRDRREGRQDDPRYDRVTPGFYAVAFVLGIAACIVVNNLMSISGLMTIYTETLTQVSEALYRGELLIELLGVGILAPLAEELFFRGLVMNRMKEVYGANIAIVFSALIFGLYHGNLLQGIYGFALGLIFAYVYERFHHILAPVAVHIGANLISVIGSETSLLDRFYQTDASILIVTFIGAEIVLLCIYVIHHKVAPELLHKKDEKEAS